MYAELSWVCINYSENVLLNRMKLTYQFVFEKCLCCGGGGGGDGVGWCYSALSH